MFNRSKTTAYIRHIACIASMLVGFTGTVQAGKIASFEIGNWSGGAYANDDSGAFSHCGVYKDYSNGRRLMFSVASNKTWSFAFSNSGWSLKSGGSYGVRYTVDGGETFKGVAKVRTRHLAQVQLPLDKRVFGSIQNGERLVVRTASSRMQFDLGPIRPMLKKLFNCAQNHIVNAKKLPESQEFEPGRRPAEFESGTDEGGSTEFPTAQTREESNTAVSFMLKMAGVKGILQDEAEQPSLYKDNDVVWKMRDMIGAFRIIPDQDLTQTSIVRQVRNSDKGVCAGQYAAGDVLRDGRAYSAFMSVCTNVAGSDNQRPVAIHYTILPRREGGHYLMMVIGRGHAGDRVEAMGVHLRDTAAALNARGSVPGARPVS